MKKIIVLPLLAGAAICAAPAHAEVGVIGSLGTTGLGLHLSVPLREQLNARLGINGLNWSHDITTTDVEYDAKLRLRTVEALLDYHPGNGGFRFTGGLIYNRNRITGTGTPRFGGSYTFNGTTYDAATAGEVDARVDFRRIAPYIGIGYGNPAPQKGWGFSADLGVMFQGTPDASVRSEGCTAPAPLCSRLAADLDAESREIRDDVEDFKAYPVVRVGLRYSF